MQWTEPFIPYVVGQEASLAPTPFPLCLRILGGTHAPDQGPLALPFRFRKAFPRCIVSSLSVLQLAWYVSPWPSLHFLHRPKSCPRGHEAVHTTYNWISDISVPQSPWPFLPLAGGPKQPFSPLQSILFLLRRCASNPHKALFFSCAQRLCCLCLIPAPFKQCPKDSLHSWNGTSGFCISPDTIL